MIPRPQIAQIEGDRVTFSDGSQVQADTIIAATGYAVEFPFLDPAIVPISSQGSRSTGSCFRPTTRRLLSSACSVSPARSHPLPRCRLAGSRASCAAESQAPGARCDARGDRSTNGAHRSNRWQSLPAGLRSLPRPAGCRYRRSAEIRGVIRACGEPCCSAHRWQPATGSTAMLAGATSHATF